MTTLNFREMVKVPTTSVGTGSLVSDASPVVGPSGEQFLALVSGDDGLTFPIKIEEVNAVGSPDGDWEICESVYTHSTLTWTRGKLLSSSTGSRIDFPAGTKHIAIIIPRETIEVLGSMSITTDGFLHFDGSLVFTNLDQAHSVFFGAGATLGQHEGGYFGLYGNDIPSLGGSVQIVLGDGFGGPHIAPDPTFSVIESGPYTNLLVCKGLTNRTGINCSPTTAHLQVQGTTTTDIVIQATAVASQSGNIQEWQESDGTVYSTISENGYITTRKTSAPADAELVASELSFWFDDTNGSPKIMFKAKQADGTVKTGSVSLS